MPRTGRPKAELVLSDVERETLIRWSRRAKTAQALALRSKIVLACADGASNKEVAACLRVVPATVGKWRARFVADRLEGLADEPRPGAARKITDEQVEAVVVKTLEEAPANKDSHWSTRSMAKATGMSQTAISRIWRAFRSQASPGRYVEAVHRSAVHRQGPRRGRVVSGPAGGGDGAGGR
jgi:transposase